MIHQNSKRSVENFLVCTGDQSLVAGGTALNTPATGAVNVPSGALGVFNVASSGGTVAYLETLAATETIADAPAIQIIQGNENSANPRGATALHPLSVRPYEASGIINGYNRIVATKQVAVAPTHSTWIIGDASTGGITALDNTEYMMKIAYRGRINDEYYSSEGTASFTPKFVTPDYTTLGTAAPVDHLIQNLAWDINRNSRIFVGTSLRSGKEPIVAIAVDTVGSTGVVANTTTAGTVLPVVTTTLGNQSITLTAAMATSIQNALSAAGLPATSRLLNVNLTTAGTTTGGEADALLIMALDRPLSFEDRIPQVKIRLDIGLIKGFDSDVVDHVEHEQAFEGRGQGRALDLLYRATHGQRKYNLDHTMDPIPEYASPVVTTASYTVYNIQHINVAQVDTGNIVESPQRELILVPAASSTTIGEIDALLGPWIASANSVGIVTLP